MDETKQTGECKSELPCYRPETLCVQGCRDQGDNFGAVSVPIYQTASFAHPALGESTGYDYSRVSNPTRAEAEKTVAALEHGTKALAFSSGMAAIDAFLQLFQCGDHIVAGDDLYGGTARIFDNIGRKNGISVTYVDTSDLKAVEAAIQENTRAIYLETPTNPMMKVADIGAIAEAAKKAGDQANVGSLADQADAESQTGQADAGPKAVALPRRILVAVDNTFLTPYFQKPLDLGADVVIHSGTKYLAGHNDTVAGFTIVKDAGLAEKLNVIYMTTGACLSPFDSWLVLRGIKTLSIRMREHEKNALLLADYLKQEPSVTDVYYTGLPENPYYELSKRQSTGFGGMISFRVTDEKTAEALLKKVKLIRFAESLGGVESLLTYPMRQTHRELSPEKQKMLGIDERLLRLSVGIEAAEDLIADLKQAFQ